MRGFIFFIGLSLIICCSSAFGMDIETDSKLTQVVVFPDSAIITRQAKLNLTGSGEYKVKFKDIIPDIDENSLKVSGEGAAQVKLFGASFKREFIEKPESPKVRELQDEVQKLQDEAAGLKNIKLTLADEKNFLDSIRLFSREQLPKDLVTKIPSASELDNTLKFLSEKLKDNFQKNLETDLNLRQIDKKIDILRKELNELTLSPNLVKRSIVVELGVEKSGSLDISVSYLLRGATWRTLYDARASFEKESVELVSYGIIKQTTGEEWNDVELYLSTAKPSIGGRMPEIMQWYLRPYQIRPMGAPQKSMPAADAIYGLAASKRAMSKELYYTEEEEKVAAVEVYAEAEEKGTAVVYKVPRRATIKSDGSEHKLPVSSQTIKADFEYSATPKLSAFAYISANVTNSPDLQLLPGRVNIFLEGDYVGASGIDTVAPGEKFDLFLGIDEGVKVKREELEKKVDETLIAGIPARTKRTTFKYKLTIENYKHKDIKISCFDAIPVSQNDEIVVKLTNMSEKPKEENYKDRQGVMRWEFKLSPNGKKEFDYSFIVEHPRTMNVEGL